jgi:transcription elongation factor GreA
MRKTPMTITGFKALEAELKHLKSVERKIIIQAIAEARLHGDLSENAEYHSAKEKQGFIEGRIRELEGKIFHAEIIDPTKLSTNAICFSATVKLIDEETSQETTYQIVGVDEADLSEGKLSYAAPLAKALIGRHKGESIEVHTPKGLKAYEIVAVDYL